MIGTMKQKRKQISDLAMDLEVINPIESKTVLGGDWYNSWWDNGDGMTIEFGGSGGWYDPFGGAVDYSDDSYGNANQGWDYGSGGGGNTGLSPADYPGGTTQAEAIWLGSHLNYLSDMIENKNIAEAYGQNQHNGVYDALRHALWSALDASDLGYEDAKEFHTLHELEHPNSSNPAENYSDIANNNWGYSWAITFGDPQNNMDQFLTDFNNAAQNGQISILPQN
jgi:hypothetical protein